MAPRVASAGIGSLSDRMIERRRLLITAATGLTAAPFFALAQQAGKVHRVGFLRYPPPQDRDYRAFEQGLRDFGYVVGQNIIIEQRYARGRRELLADLAIEMARLNLDVVVVDGTLTAIAAKNAMSATPVVFVLAADPVTDGLVASLA